MVKMIVEYIVTAQRMCYPLRLAVDDCAVAGNRRKQVTTINLSNNSSPYNEWGWHLVQLDETTAP